jgi:hypothetical protein
MVYTVQWLGVIPCNQNTKLDFRLSSIEPEVGLALGQYVKCGVRNLKFVEVARLLERRYCSVIEFPN